MSDYADFYPIADVLGVSLTYNSGNRVTGEFSVSVTDFMEFQFKVVYSFHDLISPFCGVVIHVGGDLNLVLLSKRKGRMLYLLVVDSSKVLKPYHDFENWKSQDVILRHRLPVEKVVQRLGAGVIKMWSKTEKGSEWHDLHFDEFRKRLS